MPKISILILLFLSGCATNNTKNNTNDEATSNSKMDSINQVEIITKGGRQGLFAYCKITKDSVITEFSQITNPSKNYSSKENNNIVDWENFINKIDIGDFKKTVNGKSKLPVDGTDTEIKIQLNNQVISRINGDTNQAWIYVRKFGLKLFKQEN